MIDEKLIKVIKADFKREYAEFLCKESLEDIKKAKTLADFVGVLDKYVTYVGCKPFPSTEWVRKWFKGKQDEINPLGVYLDQSASLVNPQDNIICFGDCGITLSFDKPSLWYVMLYGNSQCNIFTHCPCFVCVRQKQLSQVNVVWRHKGSIIKIHKI